MGACIGIDLGTTNSVTAVLSTTRAEVIPSPEGGKMFPSVVHYAQDGNILVGALAKRLMLITPTSSIFSIKRIMGQRYEDIKHLIPRLPYKVVQDENGFAAVDIRSRILTPEEISAEILKKIKKSAEEYLNEEITDAVVTVPAYFNDGQRQATKRAADIAGLTVRRIINEPTAASLAYGITKKQEGLVAVFDFGGGTFDISILEFADDVFEVKSSSGDSFLGGDDIDNVVVNYIAEKIKKQFGVDIFENVELHRRVYETAEKVKCELSFIDKTLINIPFLYADESGAKHFHEEITVQDFTALIRPLLDRLVEPCRQALQDAKLSSHELKDVLLVGGSTRIPAVQDVAKRVFHRDPSKAINPDEAVAIGAAIQSAIIEGSITEVILLDVTPHSLGIEIENDRFSVLIPRNSNIPTSAFKHFTTTVDNQRNVRIHVLQGENPYASANHSLAFFKLRDIPPAPKEVPQIAVKFQIDSNGILNVTALEVTSGMSREINVESYQEILSQPSAEASEKKESMLEFFKEVEHRQKIESKEIEGDIKDTLDREDES